MAEVLIDVGSYCLISWNVGIADSDFHPIDPAQRRIVFRRRHPVQPWMSLS